jgi:hypothetical protein
MPRKRKLREPHWLPFVDDSITEKKLPKHIFGLCHPDGHIEIDPRQLAKGYLETLVHELLHQHIPMASEEWVMDTATRMANAIWSRGFRRLAE